MNNSDMQEINKAKLIAKNYIKDTPVAPYECLMNEERNSAIILMTYIKQLECEVKQLGKGQHTLMQSRRKWKIRYRKEREKTKDLQKSVDQIYDDYQDIGRMYFKLNEKVEAVKVICRQKYYDPVLQDMVNLILNMLGGNKNEKFERNNKFRK